MNVEINLKRPPVVFHARDLEVDQLAEVVEAPGLPEELIGVVVLRTWCSLIGFNTKAQREVCISDTRFWLERDIPQAMKVRLLTKGESVTLTQG